MRGPMRECALLGGFILDIPLGYLEWIYRLGNVQTLSFGQSHDPSQSFANERSLAGK